MCKHLKDTRISPRKANAEADIKIAWVFNILPYIHRSFCGGWKLYWLWEVCSQTVSNHWPSAKLHRSREKQLWVCIKKELVGDFSGGPVAGNLPALQGTQVRCLVWEDSVCLGRLSLCEATTESTCRRHWGPCAWGPVLHDKSGHHNEKPMRCNEG